MFARDWRGVASAPANVVADPVRCVSNTAGAATDRRQRRRRDRRQG